jgi:DNA-binding MarR family transcriptional regulator
MADKYVLDLNRYIPAHLSFISNKLSHGASEKYRRLFGIGISEWRVIAILGNEPNIAANRICQIIGIDKALASRVVQKLTKLKLVSVQPDPNNNSRSVICLTTAGKDVHDRVLRVVKEREMILHSAFSKQEIETLLGLLHRLRAQADVVNAYEPSVMNGKPREKPSTKKRPPVAFSRRERSARGHV